MSHLLSEKYEIVSVNVDMVHLVVWMHNFINMDGKMREDFHMLKSKENYISLLEPSWRNFMNFSWFYYLIKKKKFSLGITISIIALFRLYNCVPSVLFHVQGYNFFYHSKVFFYFHYGFWSYSFREINILELANFITMWKYKI